MNLKLLSTGIVTVAIMVVLTSAVLMPTLSESTKTHQIFENDGYYYMSEDDASVTLTFSQSEGVKINGSPVSVTADTTIVATDKAILRYSTGDNSLQFKGDSSYITGIASLDLEIGGGTLSGNFTTTYATTSSFSSSYSEIYIASPSIQPHLMSKYNSTNYLLRDSEIYGFGQTALTVGSATTTVLVKVTGTIENLTIGVFDSRNTTDLGFEISDVVVNYEEVAGYKDLFKFGGVTFKVVDDSGSPVTVSWTSSIIPSEVSAEKATHTNESERALIELIPLMIFAGLVVGVIGMFVARRD